jgi:signal transduction histidine kinase
MTRRSLSLPITLAVVMILLLAALTVGWVVMTVNSAIDYSHAAPVYWTLLSVGATFYLLIVVGVVMYLTLSIKAINISRRQSNFIDSVTHELKSPIASLKLYLQTLTRRPVPDSERQEFYQFMLEDVDRLDQLINDILDAARLERGEQRSEVVDVQLDDLLATCSQEVCSRHRVPVETISLALNPCVVRASRVDLELIFRNLLDNAVKYAGDPPQVKVQLAERYDGRLVVRVLDNGRGVPIRHRKQIFRRFVRLGTELERDKPGTGLGLYIVRTLVGKLGGRIQVRGREKVSGSEFEVTLPQSILKPQPDQPLKNQCTGA